MLARFIPLAALGIIACSGGTSTAPVNDDFTLASGRLVNVDDAALRIRFLGVTADSRCPSDVQCVWAGNATVELEVRADGVTDTLALNTNVGAREGVVGDYRIVLVALAPEPRSMTPIDPSEYRVTLKVVPIVVVCTAEMRPALLVSVTDSLDPARTTFNNVAVVAVDGAFRDSAFVAEYGGQSHPWRVSLAHERSGRYTLTVRAEGYAPWTQSGIEVQRDACHVVTIPVTARLKK